MAAALHANRLMATKCSLALLAVAVMSAFVALLPKRRGPSTGHRGTAVVPPVAKRDGGDSRALDVWDNEGGAIDGPSDAYAR
jgi:hypothetical protein